MLRVYRCPGVVSSCLTDESFQIKFVVRFLIISFSFAGVVDAEEVDNEVLSTYGIVGSRSMLSAYRASVQRQKDSYQEPECGQLSVLT